MPQDINHVALAVAVRRRQLRLGDVPAEHRALVDRISRSLSDGQLQTIIHGGERSLARETHSRVRAHGDFGR